MVCAPGRSIVLRIGNPAAPSGLVLGRIDTYWGMALTSVFWRVGGHFSPPVWVERARAEINIADSPSRAPPLHLGRTRPPCP